jgi:hypothetical protein
LARLLARARTQIESLPVSERAQAIHLIEVALSGDHATKTIRPSAADATWIVIRLVEWGGSGKFYGVATKGNRSILIWGRCTLPKGGWGDIVRLFKKPQFTTKSFPTASDAVRAFEIATVHHWWRDINYPFPVSERNPVHQWITWILHRLP